MTSKTIRISMGIAAFLLAGIMITQVYWVRQAFIREEMEFERNVNLALFESAENFFKITGYTSPAINPIVKLAPNNYVVMVNSPIDANLLEVLLKTSFTLHNLYTDFDYSIYESLSTNKVFQNSIKAVPEELLEPQTELPVFDDKSYYFGVSFTTKSALIKDRMQVWMLSTIILLIIILFFIYTLFVILKQKRLSEVQKDFINNMTHEFKTPISTIEIATGVLKDPSIKDNPERLVKYVAIIETENQRLRKQVDKVLQIAGLDRGTIQLNKEALDIHEVLDRAISQMQGSLNSGTINKDFHAANFKVNGDSVHLTNIVYNLLDNAVKYSNDSPEITIETSSTQNLFTMRIMDKGIGIPREHQKHIFEKFYRVPTGNVHNVKGFGIGLHYVRLIVEAHHGSVSLESEYNEGSTFIINLPL